MKSLLASVLLLGMLLFMLAVSAALSPDREWLVFQQGPRIFEELQAHGLTTPDGLLDAEGQAAGNFVIVTPAEGTAPRREEGMFQSRDAAEAFLGQKLLLPAPAPGWTDAVIRANKQYFARAVEKFASTEYRHQNGAHILASQTNQRQEGELPPARAVDRREVHVVHGKEVTVLWLRLPQGGRLFATWTNRDISLAATLSTPGPADLSTLLEFVASTGR